MVSLVLAGMVFIVIHIGVSGTTMRDQLVASIGLRPYMIGFSLASVVSIIWLIMAYRASVYDPVWGQSNVWKLLTDILMLPAFMLVVIGLTTPNPTAVGQEAQTNRPPRGILRVTRHPLLMGVALWAFLHLVANGDLASILFFGALLIVCLAGAPSIDAKRRRALGTAWDQFAAQTSIIPFAAIAQGHNRFVAAEFGLWRPLVGALAYVLFIGGHVHIIGVSPFPQF